MAAGNPVYKAPKAFGGFNVSQIVINQSLGAGATTTFDVDVSGAAVLTVFWELIATTTTTDLTGNVFPFRGDGINLGVGGLKGIVDGAATATAADLFMHKTFDVRGLSKVRVQMQNNNAGAKSALCSVYMSAQ